jgi:hypothetical protein
MVLHPAVLNRISPFQVFLISYIHLRHQVRFQLLSQVGLMSLW